MNKICTSLDQSKKLIDLGINIHTADMYWLNRHIGLKESKYEMFVIDKSNKNIDFFNSYAIAVKNGEIVPTWSLSRLMEFVPKSIISTPNPFSDYYCCKNIEFDIEFYADNPIDAVFEMVVWLQENGKF